MQDLAPHLFMVAGAVAAALFALRVLSAATSSPVCAPLTFVEGPATSVALPKRFYSAQWLELRVGGQGFYVPASPFARPAVSALRRAASVRVGYCPAEAAPRQAWSLVAGERTLMSPEAWRAFQQGQLRAFGALGLLSIGVAGFGFLLRRNAG